MYLSVNGVANTVKSVALNMISYLYSAFGVVFIAALYVVLYAACGAALDAALALRLATCCTLRLDAALSNCANSKVLQI